MKTLATILVLALCVSSFVTQAQVNLSEDHKIQCAASQFTCNNWIINLDKAQVQEKTLKAVKALYSKKAYAYPLATAFKFYEYPGHLVSNWNGHQFQTKATTTGNTTKMRVTVCLIPVYGIENKKLPAGSTILNNFNKPNQ